VEVANIQNIPNVAYYR